MKKLFLAFGLAVIAFQSWAGSTTLSKKFGVGLWRTDQGTFITIKMGKEDWYLQSEQCIIRNGNCYYKCYVPSLKYFMNISNDFTNFNHFQYNIPFQ